MIGLIVISYLSVISMTLKQFMKPNWRKIVITVILFIISTAYVSFLGLDAPYLYGFPLPVYQLGGWPSGYTGFIYLGIIVDFIFYYLLSCLIVWIYDKFRKKKK